MLTPRTSLTQYSFVVPEGFQRAEFLLEHGAVDIVMDRREMKDRLAGLLGMMAAA